MKTVQVYDPAMCCSTGLCGNDIDPARTAARAAGVIKATIQELQSIVKLP